MLKVSVQAIMEALENGVSKYPDPVTQVSNLF